jgi:hypothetical protein
MTKKLRLALDGLAVDSFAADAAERGEGTVHAAAKPCTAAATCDCPSSPYHCGTLPYTAISCPDTALC